MFCYHLKSATSLLLLGACVASAAATEPPPLLMMDDNVVFVGRVTTLDAGVSTSFDMAGVQIKATVTGTTGLSARMSGRCAANNTFQVFLDGAIQPQSHFNTSAWSDGELVNVPLFPSGSLAADATYAVTIVKDTEPQFAATVVKPNYITFHGFVGDSSAARLVARSRSTSPQHTIEFLGDSITAGFDNQCDIPGSPGPAASPFSESQTLTWASGICTTLGAECHYNAWSGFGMVVNCCGGCGGWPKCQQTFGPDVWMRTLATVGSLNTSDLHGTTPANEWDFSKWTADAVVINLGGNDHLGTDASTAKSKAFVKRYEELVVATSKAYGESTRFFLACGPTTDFCAEVKTVIASVTASGIKAYFLNQVGFDDGAYGKTCAYGHPGSQIDAAMAKNGSAFIKTTMGW